MTVSNPKFLWSGEHWILYLRQPGESINSVSVSLYKTIYSNAGTGTVCLLQSDPKYGIEPKLLTDNREVADFVRKYIISLIMLIYRSYYDSARSHEKHASKVYFSNFNVDWRIPSRLHILRG